MLKLYIMQFKQPKDDSKYQWTQHVKMKMLYYGISESLIKRITRVPKRIEYGVAPNTVAVMQPTGSKAKPQEIWVMYQTVENKQPIGAGVRASALAIKLLGLSNRKKIISAWRYPGVTKPGTPLHIPDDVWADLENIE